MTAQRDNKLIHIADQAIRATENLFKVTIGEDGTATRNTVDILSGYNGKVAAFGISVAVSGVLPAVAMYYRDKVKPNDINVVRSEVVLDAIAKMYHLYKNSQEITNAGTLFDYAIGLTTDEQRNMFRTEVIECCNALKQVIRTYNLI